jgi:hypothetical protein
VVVVLLMMSSVVVELVALASRVIALVVEVSLVAV